MEEDDALESKYTILECFCVMIVDKEGFAERINLMSEHCQKYTSLTDFAWANFWNFLSFISFMMLVIHAAFYKHVLAFMPLGRFPMHKCERSKCNRAQIILKRGEKSRKLLKS